MANIIIPEIKLQEKSKFQFGIDLQTNYQMNSLNKKFNDLEKKITNLKSNVVPGSCVKTALNTFQAASIQANDTNRSVLVAEIAIPCKNGKQKQVDVHVDNLNDIKEIFKAVSVA